MPLAVIRVIKRAGQSATETAQSSARPEEGTENKQGVDSENMSGEGNE